MTSINYKIKTGSLALLAAVAVLTACNKEPEQFSDSPVTPVSGNRALGDTLSKIANDTMFYKVLARAGKLTLLNDKSKNFTVFAPDNNAIKTFITAASGGLIPAGSPDAAYVGFINNFLRPGQADTLVSYHIIPQSVASANIPTTAPNFPYPTMFNPASALSAFARLDAYISRRTNGAWKNNIPVIAPDIMAANGVIHTIAAVSVPPSQLLWQRIAADTGLTYLRAAIVRADSGQTIATPGSLQYFLGSSAIALGANFTVFAPTNDAFKATIYQLAYPIVRGQVYQQAYPTIYAAVYQQIYNGAIAGGATPVQADSIATAQAPAIAAANANAFADANAPAITTNLASSPNIFQNPALFPYLTAQTVKGILVYHLLGQRNFSVNIPTTTTNITTLLNTVITAHPGIGVTASFTGPFVSSATVKGLGNPSAANVLINPFPGGSSDQHYVNGVLHKIDQVLLPQ